MKIASIFVRGRDSAICLLEEAQDGSVKLLESWESGPNDRGLLEAAKRLSSDAYPIINAERTEKGEHISSMAKALGRAGVSAEIVDKFQQAAGGVVVAAMLGADELDTSYFPLWGAIQEEMNRDGDYSPLAMATFQGLLNLEVVQHDPRRPMKHFQPRVLSSQEVLDWASH